MPPSAHEPRRVVATGAAPGRETLATLLARAHQRYAADRTGAVSTVYPSLSLVEPDQLGIAFVDTHGELVEVGDARAPFPLMSVAKPFVLALVCEAFGWDRVRNLVGVNATGLPFDSVTAVDRGPGGRTNPMVNAGAIATTSLAPGSDLTQRWAFVQDGLTRFAGRPLETDAETLACALGSNHRNRAIAALLASVGALQGDPAEATELYTRQSCLSVTAVDLATMGSTLADGGVNPLTRERVVSSEVARTTLAVMTVAGLYETSGDWLVDVGVPGKSGIGGGIVTVSPGKGGLGTFSPRLDAVGNSVRGQLVARDLARGLGLDILASAPARP